MTTEQERVFSCSFWLVVKTYKVNPNFRGCHRFSLLEIDFYTIFSLFGTFLSPGPRKSTTRTGIRTLHGSACRSPPGEWTSLKSQNLRRGRARQGGGRLAVIGTRLTPASGSGSKSVQVPIPHADKTRSIQTKKDGRMNSSSRLAHIGLRDLRNHSAHSEVRISEFRDAGMTPRMARNLTRSPPLSSPLRALLRALLSASTRPPALHATDSGNLSPPARITCGRSSCSRR